MTPEALRARVSALYRAGRFAEAENLSAELLRDDPADVAMLRLQGMIAEQTGRHGRAVELLGRTIALGGGSAADYLVLGAALRRLGRLTEALTSFDRALALEPGSVEAHNYRGMVLQQLGRSGEALASFERALSQRPQSAQLHNNHGNALRHLRRFSEALAAFDRALALQADFAPAHNNRGLLLQVLGRHAEAAESYQRALALQPGFAEAHNNMGAVQCELGEAAAALASCTRALQLQPTLTGVHGNLGNALRDLQRPEEALTEYELALLEAPRRAETHCHRGNALFDLKRVDEAIASYDRALELNPQHAQSHFNRGLCRLLSGELTQGWPDYEWRRQLNPSPAPNLRGGAWLGEQDIAGKTLYVYADQALGDTIQFCRYAKLAEERGARVVLAVQPQLTALLATLSPTVQVLARGESPPEYDYHCALMSLPLAFSTTLSNIPSLAPYLSAAPQRVARWRERLGGAGYKVGVAWQGSRNRIDIGRSVPAEMFAPLAGIPGVRLISLQKDASVGSSQPALPAPPVELLGADFDRGTDAFLDSAAVMTQLDLIITCDTALAHLAGALGRPTWVALKHVPEWRWLLDRADSPWYPTMRLFRQSRRGDWNGVFGAIHAELSRLAAGRVSL